MSRAAFYVLFTASGFAGLIYESIWTHYLKLFLGHAAYAQSLVLVVFMGGMAAGAALCGRLLGSASPTRCSPTPRSRRRSACSRSSSIRVFVGVTDWGYDVAAAVAGQRVARARRQARRCRAC